MTLQRTRNREGTAPTTRHIRQLLPQILQEIGALYQERPDLILAAWPEVIGSKLAPMTEAVAYNGGVLTVKVKNSTLYSLLSQNEKERLFLNIKNKFPSSKIRSLVFRLG